MTFAEMCKEKDINGKDRVCGAPHVGSRFLDTVLVWRPLCVISSFFPRDRNERNYVSRGSNSRSSSFPRNSDIDIFSTQGSTNQLFPFPSFVTASASPSGVTATEMGRAPIRVIREEFDQLDGSVREQPKRVKDAEWLWLGAFY